MESLALSVRMIVAIAAIVSRIVFLQSFTYLLRGDGRIRRASRPLTGVEPASKTQEARLDCHATTMGVRTR
jgi:hypothetical protein